MFDTVDLQSERLLPAAAGINRGTDKLRGVQFGFGDLEDLVFQVELVFDSQPCICNTQQTHQILREKNKK